MFKSRNRERRIFTSRKRMRPRYSIFSAIVSLVLIFIVLELLTRIFVDITGNRNQFARANTKSDLDLAYQLKFVEQNFNSNQKSQVRGLKATPSVSVGYKLLGNQENKHWQINAEGFRDRDSLSINKPKDEIRIFLLGGSTAFGYGSPNNQATISEYLEQRLEERLAQQKASPRLYKPNLLPFDKAKKQKSLAKPSKIKSGKYRVINAGVPGYASGNELAQLALQVLKYKPDLIVVLDGYQDFMLESDLEAVKPPPIDTDNSKPTSFVGYVSKAIEPIENKSYLAKIAQNRWLKDKKNIQKQDFIVDEQPANLVQYLPQTKDELQKRVDRYLDRQKQILNLSAAAQIPLLVAIQPEITGREPSQLSDAEGKIARELGRTYIRQVRDNYPVLIDATQQLAKAFPKNMKVLDLYRLTDKYPSPSFIDPIHLNEAANQKVAEQLYYAIASLPKMQLVPSQAKLPKARY